MGGSGGTVLPLVLGTVLPLVLDFKKLYNDNGSVMIVFLIVIIVLIYIFFLLSYYKLTTY